MENYNEPLPVSKEDFFKKFAPNTFKKTILIASVIAYILIAFNTLACLLGNIFGFLDVAITLVFTLGVHIGKVKGCAIGLLIYGIINGVIMSISMGMFAGWAWIAIPIAYLVAFNKAEKEYKAVYGD